MPTDTVTVAQRRKLRWDSDLHRYFPDGDAIPEPDVLAPPRLVALGGVPADQNELEGWDPTVHRWGNLLPLSGVVINDATLNSPTINGGTSTGMAIHNPTITGGSWDLSTETRQNISASTISNSVIVNSDITNPTITGGTWDLSTETRQNISASTISNSVIENSTLTGVDITSGTIGNVVFTTPPSGTKAIAGGSNIDGTSSGVWIVTAGPIVVQPGTQLVCSLWAGYDSSESMGAAEAGISDGPGSIVPIQGTDGINAAKVHQDFGAGITADINGLTNTFLYTPVTTNLNLIINDAGGEDPTHPVSFRCTLAVSVNA